MNTHKLIALFLAVFAITSHAETAAQLVTRITNYNSSAGGTGTLSASYSGSTVTVTGTKTGAISGLYLVIDQNVTVIWKADLTGNTGPSGCSDFECVALINKAGRGLFEVQSGGKVAQTGAGYAIVNGNDWSDDDDPSNYGNITISGGTVSATTGKAVLGFFGTVIVSGGTVSATTGVAVQSSSLVLVTGGTVTVGTGGTKYSNHTYDFAGDGTIIEWNNPSGSKTYTAFTSNDITKLPENATAQWLNKNGKAGIGYFYNDFVEVGVTVNNVKIMKPTATSHIFNGTEQSAGIAENMAYTITGDKAATNAGNYTATVALKDKGNYEWADATTADLPLTWSIAQATGQTNEAPPLLRISASNTNQHSYSLSTITLEKLDHGTLTYTLGEFKDDDNILTAEPVLSGDGLAITYTGTGKTSGSATLVITVASQNYEDLDVTLTFEATPKEEVTITGITAQNFIYDGIPKKGYSGTATSGAYTGALVYEYAGTNYPQSETPPTNIGEYTLRITLPPDAPYIGEWRGTFSITANTPILPQIATGSIRVQATANAIMLENLPRNTKIQVYSLQGKQIYSTNSGNSQILRIPVQTKGMYIVKAGNQTMRVAVR
jgi:hypothetical protein